MLLQRCEEASKRRLSVASRDLENNIDMSLSPSRKKGVEGVKYRAIRVGAQSRSLGFETNHHTAALDNRVGIIFTNTHCLLQMIRGHTHKKRGGNIWISPPD